MDYWALLAISGGPTAKKGFGHPFGKCRKSIFLLTAKNPIGQFI